MSLTGDLNALYKVAYAKGVEDLIPEARKLSDMIDFVPSELQNGKQYEQPVVLSGEAGFTYSLDTQNAYDLNSSVGMNMETAEVPGADIVLDSTVGYNQAARASHSATSFKSAMSMKFENMLKSSRKRLEIAYLYGNQNIGTAAAQDVGSPTTSLTFIVDYASWATGIWTASENANIVFSLVSNNNAVDSLRSYAISAVNPDTRAITVVAGTQGTAGSISALETAIEANALNINWYGSVSGSGVSFAYAEMAGMRKIITNTGSLFGIDAAVYDLWRGNVVTVSGQLTMAKVLSAVSRAVQRGLETDAVVLVNPSTWADLASNLAALRRFDGSYSRKKMDNGAEALEYVSQNGTLKIVSYNIVKQGDCFIFPLDKVIRIGARELGLNDPTRPADEIFFTIPGKAGVGLRAYTNQAIFLEAPAQAVYISGIVNSL
ncbi:MAG: hypothetical protein HC838_00035 [Spirulinaceae cyanobacterium RM2_2_10]|nr:hypothetical protein [Spirulinaceae cyanobacterium RM2_2_10]